MTKYIVSVYCSMYYGPPKWHGTEIYEPDECGHEYEVVVDEQDIHFGEANVVCPRCHQEDFCPVEEQTIVKVIDERKYYIRKRGFTFELCQTRFLSTPNHPWTVCAVATSVDELIGMHDEYLKGGYTTVDLETGIDHRTEAIDDQD